MIIDKNSSEIIQKSYKLAVDFSQIWAQHVQTPFLYYFTFCSIYDGRDFCICGFDLSAPSSGVDNLGYLK